MQYQVDVFTGKIRDYDGSRPSAIAKLQVEGELILTELGIAGDEQAEKSYHGGPDRALCHYPREHYPHWAQMFPEQAALFCAPAFGENLSTEGLTEKNVFIGDIFRWGDALIQVTQPRSPCFKLNFHFGISDMSAQMQDSGRVKPAGCIVWCWRGRCRRKRRWNCSPGSAMSAFMTPAAIAWYLPFDDEQYHRLLSAAGLSTSWTRTMQKRRTQRQD